MISLLKKLIEIDSTTENEFKISLFLNNYLIDKGFTVEPLKNNLFAYKTPDPEIILCTHMDTVPPYFVWSEDTEYLYGRGSCDAKCQIVAMIKACEGYKNVGLLFTTGEETDHKGIKLMNKLLINYLKLKPKIFVIGEPTNLKMISLQKGCINGKIKTYGKKVHSGYPYDGVNALSEMIDYLYQLFNLEEDFPSCYFNGYFVDGGIASNVIADKSEFHFCIRFKGESKDIIDYIKNIVKTGDLNIDAVSEPIKCNTLEGFPITEANFVTDLNHFNTDAKKFIYGCGNILDAHTDNEKIRKKDLMKCVDGYKRIIESIN